MLPLRTESLISPYICINKTTLSTSTQYFLILFEQNVKFIPSRNPKQNKWRCGTVAQPRSALTQARKQTTTHLEAAISEYNISHFHSRILYTDFNPLQLVIGMFWHLQGCCSKGWRA